MAPSSTANPDTFNPVDTAAVRRGGGAGAKRRDWGPVVEGILLLLSPVVIFYVVRVRFMAPQDMVDPSLHTAYIVHPHDLWTRFYTLLEPTGRNREGARVGFLIPARIGFLLFGAVRGFAATRYVFALVSVVPTYLLLRRIFGRAAGATGVLVVMTCPVVLTAWGTDYPDAAVVSYLTGGLACLAMPSDRRRIWWVGAAGFLFTMAVWALASSVPLVGVTVLCYVVIGLRRAPAQTVRDLGCLAAVAAVTTGALFLGSALFLDRADFLTPTLSGMRYLESPSDITVWHSTSWRWAPYFDYLLVPPVVLGVWAAASTRRLRDMPAAQLLIGLAGAAQLLVFTGLQFLGSVWTLEYHYFSSQLWGAVCLMLSVGLAGLARPLLARASTSWLLPAAVLIVPLIYETDPHPPAFEWAPWGLVLAAVGVGLATTARLLGRPARNGARVATAAALIFAVTADVLFLTTAPGPVHARLPGTVGYPAPAYASALGGNATSSVDEYRVETELPAFVGNATYANEQLLMWVDLWNVVSPELGPAGMYHSFFNTLPSALPRLTSAGRTMIQDRRPSEVLLLAQSSVDFPAAVTALSVYRPRVLRSTELRSGAYVLYAAVVVLGEYAR